MVELSLATTLPTVSSSDALKTIWSNVPDVSLLVIQLVITNGQPPYIVEYTLVDEDGNLTTTTGGNLSNACYGSYAILVTDSYNCESEMLFVYVDALDPDTDEDGVTDDIDICPEQSQRSDQT